MLEPIVIDILAPIVLFVYNRPKHTQLTIDALKKNTLAKDSILIIYCDGPLPNQNNDYYENIEKVRNICNNVDGFKDIIIIKSDYNKGLVNSIIDGVTQTVNKFGKVIVLEDDIVTSPHFLEFMNEGLNIYQNYDNVYSVNGYCFPLDNEDEYISFLIPLTCAWSWATWKNKWSIMDMNTSQKDFIKTNDYIKHRFNIGGFDYLNMLYSKNINNIWDARWYYSVFVHHGLGLFPSKSLVKNIGFDDSGTNCGNYNPYNTEPSNIKIKVLEDTKINLKYYSKIADFLAYDYNKRKTNIGFINKLKQILKKII